MPEVVQNCVKGLGDEMHDADEMDTEAFVQAYVNIVVGACISLGKCFFWTIVELSAENILGCG